MHGQQTRQQAKTLYQQYQQHGAAHTAEHLGVPERTSAAGHSLKAGSSE